MIPRSAARETIRERRFFASAIAADENGVAHIAHNPSRRAVFPLEPIIRQQNDGSFHDGHDERHVEQAEMIRRDDKRTA